MTRAGRLRAALPPDVDGFVAADPAVVRWMFGLAGEGHELYGNTPLWAVVGPAGPPLAVVPACELGWIGERDGVRPYGRFVFAGPRGRPVEAPALETVLAAALDEAGAGEFVGVGDGVPFGFALPPRRLVPCGDAALRARRVRDAAELSALRRVNLVAEAAVLAAIERLRPGVTERELLACVRGAMVEHGARPMLGSVGIAERGALVDTVATDRALAPGEPVRFDVGCVLDGYHADLSRTAVLGQPPDWVRDAYGALLAGERAAAAAARPGAVPSELYGVAVRATRAAGLADYDRTHCGHGIGLRIYEPPLIAPGHDDPLEAGMTLCLETPLYLTGVAGLQVEDAFAITPDGCERLGDAPQDLVVAG